MIDYFNDIYLKRLNRYGYDYQSRMQKRREEDFELYKKKSVYLVTFSFEGEQLEGTFEPYTQDNTKTLHYLYTSRCVKIPPGQIFFFDENGTEYPWMVFWEEHNPAKGYNKYVMLRMTTEIKWKNREGKSCKAFAYLYGQEDNMLKDELRSRSRMNALYTENLKMSFFITPLNKDINKDDYFTVGEGELKEGYRVTGYDRHSAEGIEYVTVDPIYLYDENEIPHQTKKDNPDDFFWLKGGITE